MQRSDRASQHGMTLVELVLGVALGAIVFAALNSLVMLGFKAQAAGTTANEHVYLAGYALERIVSRTRAAPLKALTGSPTASTGDWLAPVMFCRQIATQMLRETTPSDSACSGGVVLAENITAFAAQLAPSTRPVDIPVVTVSFTMHPPDALQAITLTSSARLGGSTP